MGGKARAEKLSAERRSEISSRAAIARWGKPAKSMTNECEYVLEKWELGWLIKAHPTARGVPMTVLSELRSLFPKHAIVDGQIAHATGSIFAIATRENAEIWKRRLGIPSVASPSTNLGQPQCDLELNKTKPEAGRQASGET